MSLAVAGVELGARDPLRRVLRVEVEGEPFDRGAEPALEPLGPLVADVAIRSDVVAPDRDGVLGHAARLPALPPKGRRAPPVCTLAVFPLSAARPLALLSFAVLLAAAGCAGGERTPSAAAGCQRSWAPVAVPPGGKGLFDVEAFAVDDVWAVGERTGSATTEALVEHWDGGSWAVVPGSGAGSLSAVAGVRADDLWAVGYVSGAAAGEDTPLVQHWDGSAWEPSPVPPAAAGIDLTDVSVASADEAWAVGTSPRRHGFSRSLVLHWDGSAWEVASSPRGEAGLLGVAVAGPDDAWAVGFSVVATTQETRTLVQHWDGSAWQVVPAPSPGSLSVLYRVEAIAEDDVWAVGSSSGYGPGAALIEHWDGSHWEVVRGPAAARALVSVAAAAEDDVWSVGYDGQGPMIARWDGEAWGAVDGAPARGALEGVATAPGGQVWAVGEDGSAALATRFACVP